MSSDPLRGVRAKIKRANHHINDLDALIEPICKPSANAFTHTDDVKAGKRFYHLRRKLDIDPTVSAIFGDIVHNLRSALDHLGFALCLAGPKAVDAPRMDRLYFPIGDIGEPAHIFPNRAAGCIQGFWKPAAVQMLDRIQPYDGGKGHILAILGRLDITDKHRLLVAVAGRTKGVDIGGHIQATVFDETFSELFADHKISFFWDDPFPACPLTPSDPIMIDSIDNKVNQQFQATVDIALHEPGVIERQPLLPFAKQMVDFIEEVVIPTLEPFTRTV